MSKNLYDYRKNYDKEGLGESQLPSDPLDLFDIWFKQAEKEAPDRENNAMVVSTFYNNFPHSRVILLKEYSKDGFLFFTNYLSPKGKAIAQLPNVCLLFFWEASARQVIVRGIARKASDKVNDEYFASRPLGSQYGALASIQSETVPSREALEEKLAAVQNEFKPPLNRPDYWGGYIVKPLFIEFWQGRPNRFHDRILYSNPEASQWRIERLSP